MNLVHTCLFHKSFFTVFFSGKKQNTVTLPHRTHTKYAFLVKMKEKSKSQNKIPKKKVCFELLYQRLGHRSTRSLLDGDTELFLARY